MNDAPAALKRWLRPDWVLDVCRRHWPACGAGDVLFEACTIENPRYKTYASRQSQTKSYLSSVVRLRGRQLSTGRPIAPILHWYACLPGQARVAWEIRRAAGDRQVRLIDEVDAMYWHCADDPRLPRLREVMDPAQAKRHFPAALPEALVAAIAGNDTNLEIDVVNYRPGVRCTLRFAQTLSGGHYRPLCYAKLFADSDAARSFTNLQDLYKARAADGFIAPRPLGYDRDRNMLWMEALDGCAVLSESATADEISMVGVGLARLQHVRLQDLSSLYLSAYVAEAGKKLAKLQQVFPEHAALVRDVTGLLNAGASQHAMAPACTLHGDFHTGQLLLTDAGMALFDYDEMQRGDPLIDVANMLVAVHNEAGPAACVRWGSVFMNAYRATAVWPVDEHRLRWHIGVQFLTRAYRAFVQQAPDLSQRVGMLLRMACQQTTVSADSLRSTHGSQPYTQVSSGHG